MLINLMLMSMINFTNFHYNSLHVKKIKKKLKKSHFVLKKKEDRGFIFEDRGFIFEDRSTSGGTHPCPRH